MNQLNAKEVDLGHLLKIQDIQYQDFLPMSVMVPANSEILGQTFVSQLGDVFCEKITGQFETLTTSDAGVTFQDDGVCDIYGKLEDGSNQRQLFGDYLPLSIILSPGRTRSARANNNLTTAAPSNQLFYPLTFQYIFKAQSYINFRLKNNGLADQRVDLCFIGYRMRNRNYAAQTKIEKK